MGRLRAGSPGRPNDLSAHARAWVERSCLDQHLPIKITDSRRLREVAALLGACGRSDPPDGGEPGRVELVEAAPAGADDQVVEDGGDDPVLPSQR